MMRKVYLEGALGEKYGSQFDMNVDTFGDAFKLLQANFPDFKQFMVDCDSKNIGFTCQHADSFLDEEDQLLTPVDSGDFIISAQPAGSKSGMGKIFAAIAITALFLVPGGQLAMAAANGAAVGAAGVGGAALTAGQVMAYKMVSGIALNLALQGFQQLMAPDPSVDEEEPQSYMFNGAAQNIQEGDPVPLLYGELRVPGRMIGFGSLVTATGVAGVTGFGVQGGGGVTVTDGGVSWMQR